MGLSANADPSSGTTPGSFHVHAGGGREPYSADLAPSPPNPSPAPDVTITGTSPGPWTVQVNEDLGPGEKVYIRVEDDDGDQATAEYQST